MNELHRQILSTIDAKQPSRAEHNLRKLYALADRIRSGDTTAAEGKLLIVSSDNGIRVTDSVTGMFVHITESGKIEAGQLWALETKDPITGQNSARTF